MSHLKLGAVLLAVVLLSLPATANTSTGSADRQAIRAAYANMDRAANHRDALGAYASCAPDFVQYDEQGNRETLAQVHAVMKSICAHATSIDTKSTIDRIMLGRNTAVVLVHAHATMTLVVPSRRKTVRVVGDEADRDYWVKRAGVWKLHRSQTLSDHMTHT